MSPLQRTILEVLRDAGRGMSLQEIVEETNGRRRDTIIATSVAGAFGNRRNWLHSDTGRINYDALISISEEGRQALADDHAHREATHPMGPVQPGKFFVFIEEVQVVRRHTMVVENAADEKEAEAIARAQCEDGMYPQVMTVSTDRTFRTKPVRRGHGYGRSA